MGCRVCCAVTTPGSKDNLCPECSVLTPRPWAPLCMGLKDDALSLSYVLEHFPGAMRDFDQGIVDCLTFHLTDFGDLAAVPRGKPLVWAEGSWHQWDEYIRLMS